MNDKRYCKVICFSFLFLCSWGISYVCLAANDKDPIEATQSGVVPVTKELLTREGEPGPASPSFKMTDTSGFLVKKPYQETEKVDVGKGDESREESAGSTWDDWFLGEEESGNPSTPELIDKK